MESIIQDTSAAYLTMTAHKDVKAKFNIDMTMAAFAFSDAASEVLQEKIDRSSPDCFESYDIIEAAQAFYKEAELQRDTTPRSAGIMAREFITKPQDVFTIQIYSGTISNSIALQITNEDTEEDFWMALKNFKESWELLKQIDEMGARRVVVRTDKDEPVPLKQSAPYLARFK